MLEVSMSIDELHKQRFRHSLLDRLQGENTPSSHEDGYARWPEHLAAIANDLQHLLNTRQHFNRILLEHFRESRESVYSYGFPEINSLLASNEETMSAMGRDLEEVIGRFEPRLQRTHVSHVPGTSAGETMFRVVAEVKASPVPIRVVFDTNYDVDRRRYSVRGYSE